MHDLLLSGIWLGVFAAGMGLCLALSAAGMPRTYVRDLLHLGAGVWPLGWPAWDSAGAPIVVAGVGFLLLLAVPGLAARNVWVARVASAVSDEEERWSGLVLYGLSAVVLTAMGMLVASFPAAAGLLALALGDGIGGAIGARWGRLKYRIPWSKEKSLEGSVAVALLSAGAVVFAGRWFEIPVSPLVPVVAGMAAAIAEALSPRATDNVAVPAVVCVVCLLWG